MARITQRLSAPDVVNPELSPGMFNDGDGLHLLVSPTDSRSWILRFQFNGKRRELGLGVATRRDEYNKHKPVVTLADARKAAAEARKLIQNGIDPIEHKRATKAKAAEAAAAAAAAAAPKVVHLWGPIRDAYIDSIKVKFKLNKRELAKGKTQSATETDWRGRLETYGPPADTDIATINLAYVENLLRKVWNEHNCTAVRVLGYCERIWKSAQAGGEVTGTNPFTFDTGLAARGWKKTYRDETKPVASMPYNQLPAFWQALGARCEDSARALEFTILTACRTNETCFAELRDFDFNKAEWTRPKDKMKGRTKAKHEDHTVPLTKEAVALVPRVKGWLFCPGSDGQPMSEGGMDALLERMEVPYTVHGFRASFETWALNEVRGVEKWLPDMCMAHSLGGMHIHYHREVALRKCRELFEVWACFLNGGDWKRLRATQLVHDLGLDAKELKAALKAA